MLVDGRVAAILKTADVPATIAWYQAAGFELRGSEPNDPTAATWCELVRDGLVLQFLGGDETPWEGPPAFTGCFYVHPTSVDAVYADLSGRIDAEWGIEDRPWGARELTLQDPNGYFIVFTEFRGSDPTS